MRKKVFGMIGAVLLVVSLIIPQFANANCKSCSGILNDGWCQSQECQTIFMEEWECNVDISMHHNGDCSKAHTVE